MRQCGTWYVHKILPLYQAVLNREVTFPRFNGNEASSKDVNVCLTCVGYANSVMRRGAALSEKQSPNPTVGIVSIQTS